LPKPDPEQRFESALPRGSRGGKTKVRFASTKFGVPEVVFEISEAPHEHYTRVDNDLHTSIRITKQQALTGCTKKLPRLDDDGKIEIVIQPNQIKSSGDIFRIQGQGWPVRNAPEVYLHGDLVVRVEIVEKAKHKKRRKRNKDKFPFFD
jgi:DnaJ-class molecular chaperone